jgi:hypothetical protein
MASISRKRCFCHGQVLAPIAVTDQSLDLSSCEDVLLLEIMVTSLIGLHERPRFS